MQEVKLCILAAVLCSFTWTRHLVTHSMAAQGIFTMESQQHPRWVPAVLEDDFWL